MLTSSDSKARQIMTGDYGRLKIMKKRKKKSCRLRAVRRVPVHQLTSSVVNSSDGRPCYGRSLQADCAFPPQQGGYCSPGKHLTSSFHLSSRSHRDTRKYVGRHEEDSLQWYHFVSKLPPLSRIPRSRYLSRLVSFFVNAPKPDRIRGYL